MPNQIESPGIVEDAVRQIRAFILKSDPSDKLLPSQSQLASEIGVSRNTIREAMQVLQGQGLVEISQGKRPRVAVPSLRPLNEQLELLLSRQTLSFHQLLEIRQPIEIEATRLAALRATPDQLAKLRASIRDLNDASSIREQVRADRDFHQTLAEATSNPLYIALLLSLHQALELSMKVTISKAGKRNAIAGHKAVLKALEQNDPDQAGIQMLRHLQQARRDFLKYSEDSAR